MVFTPQPLDRVEAFKGGGAKGPGRESRARVVDRHGVVNKPMLVLSLEN